MRKRELMLLASRSYTDEEQTELISAINFAIEKHKGQKRKSGEAFVTHPLAVASILIDWGLDIDTVLAGVLHDTVEDTETSLPTIENLFGRDVAFLVDGVTKVSQARSGMRDLSSYLPATKDNLTKLLIAVGQDVRVIIIKLADRLHNMQTLQHLSREKQLKIARETLEVFAPLADRLNMGRVRVQLEELAFSYLEPKEFKRLQRVMKDRLGKSHRKLARVRHDVDKKLTEESIDHQMDGRIKSVYSLYKKLQKVDSIDDIYDLIALRIIVEDAETCYRVLGIIHAMYRPMVNRIKDYIARPKPNGYQSLHTTIITENEQIVEFQIRTATMHDYAERGLAASFHYNEQKLTDAYRRGHIAAMPADLAWISQLQEVAAQVSEGKDADLERLKVDLFGNRIFVYSPKGDLYDMPDGAFPLDYAYRIHSDIGRQAAGFRVNGKMVAFDRTLQHGDVIEVITKRNAQPRPDWLELVITRHARDKLRAQLKRT
ncbi:TPA: bifunctional (p)ppGpp synthetase/guanosine-3',5'-bis(diphosphate) 3'-pyrophosphohydrolase [Candidatus Saccharibacteria bacterium]|nr:bifunctional (p)ppGpp synthetase/guanosine-3',5'-bis(diphosphate) 3'-pyrophosphohydrolase [Candidatus Saccharibacteria bacterium]